MSIWGVFERLLADRSRPRAIAALGPLADASYEGFGGLTAPSGGNGGAAIVECPGAYFWGRYRCKRKSPARGCASDDAFSSFFAWTGGAVAQSRPALGVDRTGRSQVYMRIPGKVTAG
jgi:hypothetical protein